MSTRAIITVFDKQDSFNIYLHGNAIPEIVMPSIEKATEYAWKFPRFEAWDFATALIKVLKKRAWGVYLINLKEKMTEADYYYQVSKESWDLKIKTTALNFNHLLHSRGL